MSFAFVITELEPGGAERCMVALAIGLQTRGHDVHLISLAPAPLNNRNELIDKLAEHAITPHYLGLTRWHQLFTARRRLRSILTAINPAVVQSFLFHANILSAKVSRNSSWQLVAGLRVSDPRRVRHWMLRYNQTAYAKIICVSQDVRTHAVEQVRIAPELLKVIPNSVDCDSIAACDTAIPSQLGFQKAHPLLTFVGRLEPQKGVDILLRHATEILTKLPNHHIAIVGEGSDGAALRRRVIQLGLQTRIHFMGYRTDAVAIIKASDLLLLPSRWEGMPNVVMEAMAAGKPVLASPTDGILSLLGHAPQQISPPAKWASTLFTLMDDPTALGDLGEQNRNVILQHYRSDLMIDRYEAVYTSLSQGTT